MFLISEPEFSLFLQALQFAAAKHQEQKRKDGVIPYINHPIEVTRMLWETGGVRDITTLLAALLHDTIEDTKTSPVEIRDAFGEEVLALVLEVTDDRSLPKAERKRLQVEHAPHKSLRARQIKLADKINNIYTITNFPPKDWTAQRKREYLDWSEQVVDGLRGHNPGLEAAYDAALAQARAVLAQSE
jgi:GTP diphosphokinase / guanosine-3',5'-bis(diphosphate) 3'-diphosphatase